MLESNFQREVVIFFVIFRAYYNLVPVEVKYFKFE